MDSPDRSGIEYPDIPSLHTYIALDLIVSVGQCRIMIEPPQLPIDVTSLFVEIGRPLDMSGRDRREDKAVQLNRSFKDHEPVLTRVGIGWVLCRQVII